MLIRISDPTLNIQLFFEIPSRSGKSIPLAAVRTGMFLRQCLCLLRLALGPSWHTTVEIFDSGTPCE